MKRLFLIPGLFSVAQLRIEHGKAKAQIVELSLAAA